ncbi:hypothetical protein HNR23_000701 [Nocardiopsis mwathae]|uniref:Uncharacterized protein n=1 Tax=Nocardiopsis mwathae TaxID=1472723 RepID=A0A7W9YFQ3_9ACTN|nr:hypothetical protein [Nocardiopsis mwathae]MBB6170641.1 hypothetical protein [Nocardiopsis mwathae]
MRYAGIAVGALVSLLGTALLIIAGTSILVSVAGGAPASEPGVGAFFLVEGYMSLARIAGGIVAGMMAWRTRSAAWVIGAGAAAGLAGSIVLIGIGVITNIGAGAQAMSAGDLLTPLAWSATGALGGLIAWLLRPRRRYG